MSVQDFDAYRDPEPAGGRRRRGGKRRRRTDWLGGRGESRGEQALVPDVEFTSYYGKPIVKAPPWGHWIPAYLFLGGVAGGSQLLATGAHFSGNDALRRPTRIVSVIAIALSGGALIEDLGRKERFVNMLRTIKLTSPMSMGTWILSAYAAGAVPALAAEATTIVRLPLTSVIRRVETPSAVVGAVFSAPLAAYTSVLLSDTAVPLWNAAQRELPFLFCGSGAAASGGMAMVWTAPRHAGPARAFALVGAAADLLAMRRLESQAGLSAELLHEGRPGKLARASKALSVVGLAGTALLGRRSRVGAVASGLAFVIGSVATRFAIFEAGMESTKDPKYVVVPQRERLAARGGAGNITTGPVATAS